MSDRDQVPAWRLRDEARLRFFDAWGIRPDPDPDSILKHLQCPGCEAWQVTLFCQPTTGIGPQILMGYDDEIDAAADLMAAHLASCPEGAMVIALRGGQVYQ